MSKEGQGEATPRPRVTDAELALFEECHFPTRAMFQAAAGEIRHLRSEREGLLEALRGLLRSADASWEEQGAGHDWREACVAARAALAESDKGEKG